MESGAVLKTDHVSRRSRTVVLTLQDVFPLADIVSNLKNYYTKSIADLNAIIELNRYTRYFINGTKTEVVSEFNVIQVYKLTCSAEYFVTRVRGGVE
jgi:hypothetical protein